MRYEIREEGEQLWVSRDELDSLFAVEQKCGLELIYECEQCSTPEYEVYHIHPERTWAEVDAVLADAAVES